MDAWDKGFLEEGFPDEIDEDGDGLVYYIMPADWNGDYENREMVDGPAYVQWESECLEDAEMICPEYFPLTKENMESLGFIKS